MPLFYNNTTRLISFRALFYNNTARLVSFRALFYNNAARLVTNGALFYYNYNKAHKFWSNIDVNKAPFTVHHHNIKTLY